jgi:hypothetical protein
MTNANETKQELVEHRLLDDETRRALDEVARHSLARTGETARALEAALGALRDDAVLALGPREALEAFAGRVSEDAGVGMRYVRWRAAVYALLGALRPDPFRALIAKLKASLTPQQAKQLTRPLSEQQCDLFQQLVGHAIGTGAKKGEDPR